MIKVRAGQRWVDENGDVREVLSVSGRSVIYNYTGVSGNSESVTLNTYMFLRFISKSRLDKRSVINAFFNGD